MSGCETFAATALSTRDLDSNCTERKHRMTGAHAPNRVTPVLEGGEILSPLWMVEQKKSCMVWFDVECTLQVL